jgi:2-methylisocitrate lyase-like PEP mutase family enzyme
MDSSVQRDRATRFQQMHVAPEVLVLPNAWDVGSAVVFERAGFDAIATTSAGIAYSLGNADGENIALDDLLEVEERIARRIAVPLSVDIERGYGGTVAAVCETVREVIRCGAVGFNIEDGVPGRHPTLVDIEEQCAMLRAIAGLKGEIGIDFVLNARTDGMWLGVMEEEGRLEDAVERGNRYLAAGADCVFVPGVLDVDAICRLVSGLEGPLNVIATPACPSVAELSALGVARLSLGSGPVRAAYTATMRMADELRTAGTLASALSDAMSYAEANELFGWAG